MQSSPDAPSQWVASLSLAERDQYLLLARLRDAQGRVFLSPQSFQIDAILFAQPRAVVVFASADEAASTDIEEVLAGRGLEADAVEDRFWDNGLYESILEDYPGGLAILTRNYLDQRGQAAFRRYAEGGGSLLISSFGLADSPQVESFLEEVLHVGLGGGGTFGFLASNAAPGFNGVYIPLVPRSAAIPLVWDLKGRTAGVQVDAGVYRVVYLSFDLQLMKSPPRRLLLEAALEFLRPSPASDAADCYRL